jgi:microcystin-dependent protein
MSNGYLGEIRIFGGNFPPVGWSFCDGSLLEISDWDELFELIGTTYGGDGQATFALPNLTSRIMLGDGGTLQFAETGGVESVTLTPSQIPIHAHSPVASNNASSTTPASSTWATWGDGQYAVDGVNTPMDPTAIASTGGGQAHENRPPFLAVNFIIAMSGVFPSQ